MKAVFQIEGSNPRQVEVDFNTLIVAGWAGRDMAAIEHHIEELAAIGVLRPTSVPLYYRIADNQLTQADTVQAVGGDSSGEVETFVFAVDGEMYVSIASDHTDRKLETYSVALSKQVCVKPVARAAWPLADVAGHWDELVIRSYIVENGERVLYQEGLLASLRTPQDLIAGYTGGGGAAGRRRHDLRHRGRYRRHSPFGRLQHGTATRAVSAACGTGIMSRNCRWWPEAGPAVPDTSVFLMRGGALIAMPLTLNELTTALEEGSTTSVQLTEQSWRAPRIRRARAPAPPGCTPNRRWPRRAPRTALRAAGVVRSAVEGLPVSIKDLFDVKEKPLWPARWRARRRACR